MTEGGSFTSPGSVLPAPGGASRGCSWRPACGMHFPAMFVRGPPPPFLGTSLPSKCVFAPPIVISVQGPAAPLWDDSSPTSVSVSSSFSPFSSFTHLLPRASPACQAPVFGRFRSHFPRRPAVSPSSRPAVRALCLSVCRCCCFLESASRPATGASPPPPNRAAFPGTGSGWASLPFLAAPRRGFAPASAPRAHAS